MAGASEEIEVLLQDKYDAVISRCDYDIILKQHWSIRSHYLFSPELAISMHQLIIGPRPDDVPDDWVIDHIDRNKNRNSRSNLRWVSRDFNSWNTDVRGVSRFKGVSFNKKSGKWLAQLVKKYGHYNTEREAAKVVAREAIRKWPLWAKTSDLLFGEGLLTQADLQDIQTELQTDMQVIKPQRDLPVGVHQSRSGKYIVVFRGQFHKTYDTISDAEDAYKAAQKRAEDEERTVHWEKEITRNKDGVAIIKLNHDQVALVDDELWYALTFKRSWYFANGYACGNGPRLHQVVYQLLNPTYIPSKEFSIDHKNYSNTLDNRSSNLRLADRSQQRHNQARRAASVSKHFGVQWKSQERIWSCSVCRRGVTKYGGQFILELDAARAYNILAQELFGSFAQLNDIPDEHTSVGFDENDKRIGLRHQRKRLAALTTSL